MASPTSRVGQQFGNYRLERLLGRGGFAEVYLGRHQRLAREAAIKVLHTYLSDREVEEFQREAQIIAALDHPHIVRILDFDVQQGVPFLVMDYLPNGTLRQRHPKGERVPLPTVVSYVAQVASALQYAHEQRLIHRDIKPENMLVGRRNEIVLSDFGIAAIAHSTSSMTEQVSAGTAPYMAPEQIQAQARAASDQYALAIVAYEWLGGERPFEGTSIEIFAKHLMIPPPSLRQKAPSLPVEVEQVILTALEKDPGQRFRQIQAFARALTDASQRGQQPNHVLLQASPSLPVAAPLPPSASNTPVAPPSQKTVAEQPLPPAAPASHASVTTPQTAITASTDFLPPPAKTPARQLSRRTVLIGLGVGTGGLAGAGVLWWMNRPRSSDTTGTASTPAQPAPLYTYGGHTIDSINIVAWSPDGKRIASGAPDSDDTVQVWDASNGAHPFIYHGHTGAIITVAWSPDSKRIASGGGLSDRTVHVWDAANAAHPFIYRGHVQQINAVAWSPDGQHIASAAGTALDKPPDKTVHVWDAANGGHVFTYQGHTSYVNTVAWSPDGKRIASGGSDSTVHVWDAANGGHVFIYHEHTSHVIKVAWSPDGKRIASASWDNTIQVWNAANGGIVLVYTRHTGYINAMAWSPDGKYIASGGDDNTIHIWNATTGTPVLSYQGHTRRVQGIAWSPDSKRIVSCGDDKWVKVWDVFGVLPNRAG
ncbi:hypothetical protein KSF_077680 [Reticulibacter mediterranei]|uniref:Protein kinase domain-containing protein n=1 Tax=Reticulibacter mediterranei TaxID=2778369 RepID=A0A8J3N6S0_9CHLR|nr:serine/threonine-protein kinase [Reticulibacter mediterranei]GHO97720.1 hypothetical protein KSF_077680 [Reticulibacter mediterranei]